MAGSLGRQCVVVFVGNYSCSDQFYELLCRLGMHLQFRDFRRNQIAPWTLQLYTMLRVLHRRTLIHADSDRFSNSF